jgi:hypothetical protein
MGILLALLCLVLFFKNWSVKIEKDREMFLKKRGCVLRIGYTSILIIKTRKILRGCLQ